jgi:hypothetical protein
MSSICEIFSNREIAIIIWLIIFLIWGLSKRDVRKSFFSVLKAFSAKPIITATLLMVAYISLMVAAFYKIGLWDATKIKDTIIWSVTVAFVMLVNINKTRDDEYYFKNTILDNMKLVVVLEYILNLYVFDLIIELILTPVLAILVMMIAIAEYNSEYKQVEKFLNGVLSIIGIVIVIFSIYNIVVHFNSFATAGHLTDFLLPPIFTIAFLPFVYLMALYVSYEILFIRIGFFIKDPDLAKYTKRKIIFAFHFDLKSLNAWSKQLGGLRINDKDDVLDAIKGFKVKQR